MKIKAVLLVFLVSTFCFGQCISGDCVNGKGKYDYGFAVYEGSFKNGKAHGQGTMDYGGGERYVGSFKDGQEDGDGTLFKNNVPQEVTYVNGKVLKRALTTHIGGNAPVVKGCVQGDCYNGFGIVNYDSGNRFEGDFTNGLIGKRGKFIYKNGDYYEGQFENELNTNGKYYFAQEQVTYKGTFYPDGRERTGQYHYAATDATVKVTNGTITEVHNPAAEKLAAMEEEMARGYECRKCKGKGMCGGGSYLDTQESYYSINYVNNRGDIVGTSSGNVARRTTVVNIPLTQCDACKGKGRIFTDGVIINSGKY